jgi:tetratricopeptide (TPR) repeat protein
VGEERVSKDTSQASPSIEASAAATSELEVPRLGEQAPAQAPKHFRWLDGERSHRALDIAFVALLGLAPLVLSSSHFSTAIGLSLAALLLALWAALLHRHQPSWLGFGGAAILLLCVHTALQVIPIPIELVELLSPETARQHLLTAQQFGLEPGFVPVSRSPARSAMGLWTLLGFLSVFMLAYLHYRSDTLKEKLLTAMTIAGALFVVLSALQTSLDDRAISFIPEALDYKNGSPLNTPLVVSGHAASLLGLLCLPALGLAISTRDGSRRHIFLLLYFLLSAAMVLTLHLPAMINWALAHALFALLVRSARIRSRALLVGLLLLALGSTVFGGYAATRLLAQPFGKVTEVLELEAPKPSSPLRDDALAEAELVQAAGPKQRLAPLPNLNSWQIVSAAPAIGTGRDSFVEVFSQALRYSPQKTLRHLSNQAAETALEHGWTVLVLVLVLAVIAWLRAALRLHPEADSNVLHAALLAALGFAGVQSLFDFGIRFPGVGFAVFALFGLTLGSPSSAERKSQARWPRWFLVALLLFPLIVAIPLLPAAQRGMSDAQLRTLREAIRDEEGLAQLAPEECVEHVLGLAKDALLERPADGYLRFLVGVGLLKCGPSATDRAAFWLQEALQRSPGDHRIHLLLGRLELVRAQPLQAAEHFAQAASLEQGPSVEVLRSVAQLLHDPDALEASLSQERIDWSVLATELIAAQRFADALELGERLELRYPEAAEGIDIQIRAQLALDFPEASLGLLSRYAERFPESAIRFLREAQLRLALGEFTAAKTALDAGLELHPREQSLLLMQAELLLEHRDALGLEDWKGEMERAIEKLRPVALSKRGRRDRYHHLRAQLFLLEDKPRLALRAYEEALRFNPDFLPALRGGVQAALELGDFEVAKKLIEQADRQVPDEELKGWLAELEARQQAFRRGPPIPSVAPALPESQESGSMSEAAETPSEAAGSERKQP